MGDTAINSSVVIGVRLFVNDWYDPAWPYRIPLTIDHTKVDTANQTDYPAYFNEHDLPASFWTNVKADGTDIVVTSSNGMTKLKRELVAGSWSRAGETMELHVKVPTLSHTEDTVLYLYYGNAAGAETNDTDTWGTNFMGVYHGNDDPDTSHIKDSTSNSNDGTKIGADEPVEAAGLVGKAQSFDGGNDYINLGHPDDLKFEEGDCSFEILAKTPISPTQSYPVWVSKGTAASPGGYLLYIVSHHAYVYYDAVNVGVGTTDLYDNANHLIGLTKEGNTFTLYVDGGIEDSKVSAGRDIDSDQDVLIGARAPSAPSQFFQDLIDEVRISNIARDANWIKTTSNNLLDVANFYSVGTEEEHAGRQIAISRASSVIVGELVSATRTLAIGRASPIIVGVLASATRAIAIARASSVIVGVKVTASRALAIARAATTQIGVVVSATRALAISRASSVIVGIVASASRVLAITRSSSVLLGLKATAVRVFGRNRTSTVVIGLKVSISFTLSRMIKVIPVEGAIFEMKSVMSRIYRMIAFHRGSQ